MQTGLFFHKRVLTWLAIVATVGSLTIPGQASEMVGVGTIGSSRTQMLLGKPYTLHLHHLHTGESLNITYRIGNTYLPDALAKLNYFLRDHRTMASTEYDPREFDLLHSVMAKLGRPGGLIEIVCGYRTPESNQFLRSRASVTGVAEHSQHMEGRAIDVRVPGVRTVFLRDAARSLAAGGVGYYPSSQFVHMDVGPIREWQFGGRRRSVRIKSRSGTRARTHRHSS